MPEAGGEEFLDQIIFFVVESSAAEMSDGGGLHEHFAIAGLLKAFARAFPKLGRQPCPSPVRDRVRAIPGIGCAVLHFLQAAGMSVQFDRCRRPSDRDGRGKWATRDRLRWKSACLLCDRQAGRSPRRNMDRSIERLAHRRFLDAGCGFVPSSPPDRCRRFRCGSAEAMAIGRGAFGSLLVPGV